MYYKFIFIILFFTYSSCSNSQNSTVANYKLNTNSSSKVNSIKAPILKANDLFKIYTSKKPKEINLIILDSIAHLKHNPTTENKDNPEAYLSFPLENLTRVDTLAILEAFKNRLNDRPNGTTFVILDSLGNVVTYLSGFQKLNRSKDTKITSTTNQPTDKNKGETVRLENLKEYQAIQLAMKDYYSINQPIDLNIQYISFLWLNLFYEYFDVNESSDPTVKPEWLLNFSVIDAANLQLPHDFKMDEKKLSHLKVIFNGPKGYVLEHKFDVIGSHNLLVPRKDNYYTDKWKYIILNLSNQFTSKDKTFNQMILTVSYLKSKYGNDVIKNLTKWYVESDRGALLITSFLKEKYKVKTNINEMNLDYLNWIKERK